ncbi:HNH endonuclease [Microbacterium sp. B19]|uniref:HNH endonuclease n=1 Tax=Microbacterium sp. B19 TaxID=96765 RepID=UPI0009FEBE9F|nr:HNH endonuclease [Microbacterium sp. B19]
MAPDESSRLLSSRELHERVEDSLVVSGLSVTAMPQEAVKPFGYAIGGNRLDEPTLVRIYAWNVTHGGGHVRAPDEFRIQLTTYLPAPRAGEVLIIVGWSQKHRVFVGWDPSIHDHRSSDSPSLQVREEVMRGAAQRGFAAATRTSGDIVVAFRPQLLATYCLNVRELHESHELASEWTLAADASEPSAPDTEDQARSTVERRLRLAFRAWDFSYRIRMAYRRRCAMCGLGLGLIEGAHIVPVAWPGSTDQTDNGLALCRNHHAAYDSGIISVSPEYEVQVSARSHALDHLDELDRRWLDDLDGRLLRILPASDRERPSPRNLAIGREARRWEG